MPRLGEPVTGALRGDRAAVELARQAHREVADVDHLLHLAEPLLRDLPHLERHERTKCVLLAPELLTEQPHELAPVRPRQIAPDQKRRGGAPDRGVGRGSVGAADTRQLLAGDRRPDDEVTAFDPHPIDTQAFEQRYGSAGGTRLHSDSGSKPLNAFDIRDQPAVLGHGGVPVLVVRIEVGDVLAALGDTYRLRGVR